MEGASNLEAQIRSPSKTEESSSQLAAKSTKGKKKPDDADKDSDDLEERNEGGDTDFDRSVLT